jgi:class 3 adenylate cyclase/CHASE2 domain-containing sensor protein
MAVIALGAGLIVAVPLGRLLRGWTIDAETTLRWRILGARHPAKTSTTVVIALDEETYRTPPFKGSPTLTWTSDIGGIVGAALDAGAKVVGFDIVFASSIEDSAIRFREGELGASLRGFDRDYLRTLAGGARAGKIVLGEIATTDGFVRPSAGQQLAVGGDANIRALNVQTDIDDVVRRVPVAFASAVGPVPSLSLELAGRGRDAALRFGANGDVELGGWRVPTGDADSVAVAFSGAGEVPVYSLADLAACLKRGDTNFFRRNFSGKIVLVGLNVANEDRLLTARRFLPTAPSESAERCSPPPSIDAPRNGSIAGVFLQALAVENLIRHQVLMEPPRWVNALLAIAAAAAAGFAVVAVRGGIVAGGAMAASVGWLAASVLASQRFYVLPLLEPAVAGLFGALGGTLVRFVGVDREQRFLRRAFGLYLAPEMVERISRSGALPMLGGETREVTLFFSDLVGFSTMSETMAPEAIVSLMNAYLTAMSEEIERAGGFVDKFIGDAIVAIFGAPVSSSAHPSEAVAAALSCRDRLQAFNRGREIQLRHRIGLNAGEALIGNVGSPHRFNYTAFGDAVNLAARLEQANASYRTSILASESVAARAREDFVWREIDTIRVPGRTSPVTIFEPLARRGEDTERQRERAAAYEEGLQAWRNRDVLLAERCFSRFPDDEPARAFSQRCRDVIADPADAGWTPVNTLRFK